MKIRTIDNAQCNNVNFGDRTSVNKLANRFATELLTEATSSVVTFEQIQKLAKKFVPTIQLRRIKASQQTYDTVALCTSEFPRRNNKFDLNSPIITLFLPRLPKEVNDEYFSFIGSVVHEMTHALQHTDKEFSYVNMYNDFLRLNGLKNYQKNLNILDKEFNSNKLIDIIMRKFDFAGRITEAVNTADDNVVKTLVLPESKVCRKFVEEQISSTIEILNRKKKKFDLSFIKSLIEYDSISECDAYKQELRVLNKCLPDRTGSSTLYEYIYKAIADALKNIR